MTVVAIAAVALTGCAAPSQRDNAEPGAEVGGFGASRAVALMPDGRTALADEQGRMWIRGADGALEVSGTASQFSNGCVCDVAAGGERELLVAWTSPESGGQRARVAKLSLRLSPTEAAVESSEVLFDRHLEKAEPCSLRLAADAKGDTWMLQGGPGSRLIRISSPT